MRIRKGHRCLPLPPADRSSLQEASGKDVGVIDDGAKQALLSLVALASVSVADNLIGGPQHVQLEYADDTSTERNKCLERDLEQNRVSADDDFNYRSPICNAGVASTVREPTETPSVTKFVYTRREPLDTTGTISRTISRTTSRSTSAMEIQQQPDLLEQSLCHIYSRAGMTGLSVRDAVAQMIKKELPGLNRVGEGLVEEVAILLRHSSKFVECKERGTYYLRDLPAGKENKLLSTEDSELHNEKTGLSSDMLGAAKYLRYLQKSRSNSLGSDVEFEPSETPPVRGGNQKAVQNMTEGLVTQSKVATVHKDVTAMNHNSSPRASRSQNVTQMDPSLSQCTRDDGKGWRCSQPAHAGFTMCSYHRHLILQGKERRKRARLEGGPNVSSKSTPFRYVANARLLSDAIMPKTSWSPFLDDELSCDEHRQFVKAKSIRSLLLNTDVRPRHVKLD